MVKKCNHEYKKVPDSEYEYFDYSGYKVLKIKYICEKCNKVKFEKVLPHKQLGMLIW